MSNYWREVVANGLEEVGIAATPAQIERLVEGFAVTSEQYSGPVSGNDASEARRLKSELAKERAKIWCPTCRGQARIRVAVGTSHVGVSDCLHCNGTGKLDP